MIYSEVKGRLGNQFFRYAYARRLQIERGGDEKLTLGFSNMKGKDANNGWCDSLVDFNVQEYARTDKRLIYYYGNFRQIIIASIFYFYLRVIRRDKNRPKIIEKWQPLLDNVNIHIDSKSFHKFPMNRKGNVLVDGDFQCPGYFDKIRDVLLEEFTPKWPLRKENEKLFQIIEARESVCVTIRRGDFLDERYKNAFYLCDVDYFKKGVEIIKQKVKNPVFIIFSDDVEWSVQNLKIEGAEVFAESGNDPLWEKTRLMYSCKHFIISNSSFSWWVQYLSRNKDKIVVCPSRWMNDDRVPYLIADNFITIPV